MTLHLGWPQALYLLLTLGGLLASAQDHGKPKTGKTNFWPALVASILCFALLIWGGFFR